MTEHRPPPAVWTRLVRSLRPSHGARINAAEGVEEVRTSQSDRAQAAAAFADAPPPLPDKRRVRRPSW